MQKVQDQSAVMQLARQIALPGNGLTIPVITGDPSATWVDETGIKPASNPSLSTKIMQAYKLAVSRVGDEIADIYRAVTAENKKAKNS